MLANFSVTVETNELSISEFKELNKAIQDSFNEISLIHNVSVRSSINVHTSIDGTTSINTLPNH